MVATRVNEREQIRICRVLCIFFMMSVHVNPGLGNASFVSFGQFHWIGSLWGEFLGRTSVAALSFVSGYLLVRTSATRPLGALARRRVQSVLVPMLTWNLIFLLLQVAKVAVLGHPEESALLRPDTDLLATLTGLTGPTANLSLFFLRDLFVSALIVHLLAPVLAERPVPMLCLIAAIAVFDLAEPVIFRPSILFFVAAGAAYAKRANSLAAMLGIRVAAPAAALIVGGLVLVNVLPWERTGPVAELEDLLRRSLLVIGMLRLSALLTGTRAGNWLLPLERRIFETYLLHVPLFGVLWVVWTSFIGGQLEASYVLFFLFAPALAIAAGTAFGTLCDRAPAPLQKLLRGKSRQRPKSDALA